MTDFPPIAIVGRSFLVPGAANAAQLWMQVSLSRDLLSDVSPEQWGISRALLDRFQSNYQGERIANNRAGFVKGFEKLFHPGRFGKHADFLSALDRVFQWTVWSTHQALTDASLDTTWVHKRAGLVMGNLGLPTPHMAQFARAVWLGGEPIPPALDRFSFGSPAQFAATVLQLGLGGYSIDAACASSLYAIKLACDRLHDGDADAMVAGGIHCTDGLFVHQGFTALGALVSA